MPLPTISTPTYELILPSSDKKIRYRPFLVKEEKILILAMESQDSKQIARAVKDVLSKCILSKGIKVERLSTFDIEFLFLNIRGKSVGEQIEVMVTCPDDGKTQVPMAINIDSIQIQRDEAHQRDIKLDDTYTLRMKYPSLSEFIKTNFSSVENMNVDDTFDLIASCIDQVY
ncbi:MAG: baseplate protein, partial [Pseudomonadota bacterium]|nr:baseplate protein [Pseudomonadota bacterium]